MASALSLHRLRRIQQQVEKHRSHQLAICRDGDVIAFDGNLDAVRRRVTPDDGDRIRHDRVKFDR